MISWFHDNHDTIIAMFDIIWHHSSLISVSRLTQVRPYLQDVIKKAALKFKSTLPGQDQSEVMANMEVALERESLMSSCGSVGEKGVMMWLTESASNLSQRWLKGNDSKSVKDHPAYVAILPRMLNTICTCKKDPSSCPSHELGSMTLADLCWSFGDFIFEVVPSAVPSLAMALNLKATDQNPSIPEVCRFMCEKMVADQADQVTRLTWPIPRTI